MSIDPLATWTGIGVAVLLGAATMAVSILQRSEVLAAATATELYRRIRTWAILAPAMLLAFVLGPVALKIAAGVLGILCFREFARATGLFRERAITLTVHVSIGLLTLAALRGRPEWQATAAPLLSLAIIVIGVFKDRPDGYLQRVALGVLGFVLFGVCLAHVGLVAGCQPDGGIVLWLLMCVALNDVAAYLCGRMWGRRKLCPRTSPNKTVAGALGALVFTGTLSVALGATLGLNLASPALLFVAGALCSAAGTTGDLVVSSIKRDLRIKDMSAALPGHGGILDRFDSMLAAAPCIYYFILWTNGIAPVLPPEAQILPALR